MSKLETPSLKFNVTKRNAQDGDISEQIQFVLDVIERLMNLSAEDKSGKKPTKISAKFILWWILHFRIPLQEDIPTDDSGDLRFGELDLETYAIDAAFLEANYQYIVDRLSHVDHLDIFGHKVDESTVKYGILRQQMVNFPVHLFKEAIEMVGNLLKEHSTHSMEILYFEDQLAPLRMFQEIIGRIVADILRYQGKYETNLTLITNGTYDSREQVLALLKTIGQLVFISTVTEDQPRPVIEQRIIGKLLTGITTQQDGMSNSTKTRVSDLAASMRRAQALGAPVRLNHFLLRMVDALSPPPAIMARVLPEAPPVKAMLAAEDRSSDRRRNYQCLP